jgi:hypothetical protein
LLKVFGDQAAEFRLDLAFVFAVACAADEQVRTVADVDVVLIAPLHKFEIVYFHFCTSDGLFDLISLIDEELFLFLNRQPPCDHIAQRFQPDGLA